MTKTPEHIVVFTGAGISAESGLHTFRDSGGLWEQFPVHEVATRTAWKKDREKVLHFYNLRRQQVRQAQPNAAHLALAKIQHFFQVNIITQNIDDLHERAGSKNILHLHGEIMKSRSTVNEHLLYELDDNDIAPGDKCERGSQLRPHVVWFGENVPEFKPACKIARQADLLLVIGTSLQVYPAAALLDHVSCGTPIVLVSPEMDDVPDHITWHQDTAVHKIPEFVDELIGSGLPSKNSI
jgi:NAD-dependent deacetylase